MNWQGWSFALIVSALFWLLLAWVLAGCSQIPARQALVQPACLLMCQLSTSPMQSDTLPQEQAYRVMK